MRKVIYYLGIISLAVLFGCSQAKKHTVVNLSGMKPGTHLYKAIFDKDSASLKLNIAAGGRITGDLLIRFTKGGDTIEVNSGDITGEFRGDTLFADYNFTSGKYKTIYSNPIALLHKGDTLIMGKGRMMSYLGRSYLDPQTPINFGNVKFRFVPIGSK
jgi:hypothetical protein